MTNQSGVSAGASGTAPVASPPELAALCLLKLNRAAEAEALLRGSPPSQDGAARLYYLATALAEQGRVEEAVDVLRQARKHGGGAWVAEPLLALLKRQAGERIAREDWAGASEALGLAAEIAPTDGEVQRLLAGLGDRLPIAYLLANRRAESAAAWEQAQRQDPSDLRIAHSLGLLYFWWAQDLEARGKGKEADAAWEGAIRNWVALAHADSFWARWKKERERICGPIEPAALASLRRQLTEQLGRRLADYQNDYLTQKRDADERRLSRLYLALAAEQRTAEALARVAESLARQGRQASLPPLCGVLMLTHLGQLATAENLLALVEATQTNEESTEQLHWCLSPWVFPWVMIQERRHEEAIAHLEDQLRRRDDPDGHDLLAIAYLERGKLLAESEEVEQAIAAWQAGLGHVRAKKQTGSEIRRELEEAAIKEARRLRRNDDRASVGQAIRLLESALRTTDAQRVKEYLSALYTQLVDVEFKDQTKSEAAKKSAIRAHLEKALKLNSNNAQAKEYLAVVLVVEGIDLFNAGRQREAVDLLRRAYQLDPASEHVRKQVSLGLSNYGVACWNKGNRTKGLGLLLEALQIDPGNEHARKNLAQAR